MPAERKGTEVCHAKKQEKLIKVQRRCLKLIFQRLFKNVQKLGAHGSTGSPCHYVEPVLSLPKEEPQRNKVAGRFSTVFNLYI